MIWKFFWDEKEATRLFQELPFYNAPIEPYIKRLNSIDLQRETSKAFKGYARSYSIEIIDSKDPSVQLTANKPSIEDFFKIKIKI